MILITGASGLIGRALVKRFIAKQIPVRAQARTEQSLLAVFGRAAKDQLEFAAMDLACADVNDLDKLCSGCSTVIHCAALVHNSSAAEQEYALININATRHLAIAARNAAADCFVFLSTSAVYGDGPFQSHSEKDELKPETAYARSKRQCELILQEVMPAPKTIVLRPGLVFGKGDRGNMQSLIRQIGKGMYFHIGGNSARKSIIFNEDLATAVLLAMERTDNGFHIFNVANPEPVRVIDLANQISQVCGKSAPLMVPRKFVDMAAALCERVLGKRAPLSPDKVRKLTTPTTLDVSALVKATGFEPNYSLTGAIKEETDWLIGSTRR